ncbi:MAG: methyltransferase domain-containing protein [Desulfobacteraceae bacterium]|jgi:SAM-dependent methyltransferase
MLESTKKTNSLSVQDIQAIDETDFWIKAWARNREDSISSKRKIRNEEETIEFWNRVAPSYDKHTSGKKNSRVSNVINILKRDGILTKGAEILDVGCGPGTYALHFARSVKSITALDSAGEMCRLVEKRAKADRLNNIKVINRLWKDVTLEEDRMSNRFDLVFASMTPAVNDFNSLMKLIGASKGYCCLISSVRKSFDKARNALWKRIFNEERIQNSGSFIYNFNLLYSMGYRPTVNYIHSSWVREEPAETIIDRLSRSFWLYTEISAEVEKTITKYVNDHSIKGIFREEMESQLGVMIWNVNHVDAQK